MPRTPHPQGIASPMPLDLPQYLAMPEGQGAEQLQYLIGMAKKLTAKAAERAADAALILIFIFDHDLHRAAGHETVKAFLKAEGLAKSTAYETMKAVRRFGVDQTVALGVTKARALASLPEAEAIIASGFDYRFAGDRSSAPNGRADRSLGERPQMQSVGRCRSTCCCPMSPTLKGPPPSYLSCSFYGPRHRRPA